MKNKYLAFYTGFVVLAVPTILGDMYRDYSKRAKEIK